MSFSSVLLDNRGLPSNAHYLRSSHIFTPDFTYLGSFVEKAVEVTNVALPLINFLYPAGRVTSYAITFINLTSGIASATISGVNRMRAWNILKAGAELGATVTGLKNGLLVHTAMHLVENFWNLYHLKKWDREQITPKILRIVPQGFYILALLFSSSKKTSYALTGLCLGSGVASLIYAAYSHNQDSKEWFDKSNLYTFVNLGFAGICAIKAFSCYQQLAAIENFSK